MKRNEGFTLVELIVTIAIGTLVTAAASTLLLMGLRINARSMQLGIQQNTARLLMEVVAQVAAEEGASVAPGEAWSISKEGTTQVSYQNGAIYVGQTQVLDKVAKSEAVIDGQVLTISITMEDGKYYETKVYCRFLTVPAEAALTEGDALQTAYSEGSYRELLDFILEVQENSPQVAAFLETLASQYDSRGQILNAEGAGTGEYFSEWYIGGYENNPGWDADTPWCACFLAWALDRCGTVEDAPRYANVDTWWVDVVTGKSWISSDPETGDIVFFDWISDDRYDPQHVGAVLAVTDGWIYTIEGNSGNRVAICRYEAEDPCILGYAKLDWK